MNAGQPAGIAKRGLGLPFEVTGDAALPARTDQGRRATIAEGERPARIPLRHTRALARDRQSRGRGSQHARHLPWTAPRAKPRGRGPNASNTR